MDMEMDDDMDTKRLEAYGRATDHQKNLKNNKTKKTDIVIECTKISRKCNRKKSNFDCRYGLEIYFFRQSNHFFIILKRKTSKALKKYLDLLINNC